MEKKSDKLNELRSEIDIIDNALCKLLLKRLTLVREIGQYKSLNRLPVSDNQRETDIIRRVSSGLTGREAEYVQKIFWAVFDVSKQEEAIEI